MAENSAEFAIVGAGPAGAHLASRLAAAGRETLLFDPKGAWEKPCGGGVPARAIREFSFLLENSSYPHKLVRRLTMISPEDRRLTLSLQQPFAIYSRKVLNGLVLDRALAAGARFVRASVGDFRRQDGAWQITTNEGEQWRAKFLVGADGAASFLRRRLVGIFPVRDLALAFGYNVEMPDPPPGGGKVSGTGTGPSGEEAVVRFPKNFTGYLWAFPRPGVMNFGVASKLGEKTSGELRELLVNFVKDYFGGELPVPERMKFFGAKIPTLDPPSWSGLQTTGEGWALIGDAAGFADPITGEGIYYAFKSSDLLANALVGKPGRALAPGYEEAGDLYESSWRRDFGRDLEQASSRLQQFYHGHFFGHVFSDAVVRLARFHKGVRIVLERALMGEQSYVTLKRDLLRRVFQVF
ncbi:MAG TPA: NAD(P)/FAD-dependent oxidoreductase [Blastocatellia bacterium]|jgi:flavin-dependent dehydrogenase|nr:NAD(P)/FAD-dependent oxidoreductase [Blastocatellia bacterium]